MDNPKASVSSSETYKDGEVPGRDAESGRRGPAVRE